MENLNLKNEKSASEALRELTKDIQRTELFLIRNNSRDFELVLVLAQGYDEVFKPEGYQIDTGLTVTGKNVMPGTTQTGLVQAGINVLSTHTKCSLHWKRRIAPFDEGDLNLEDHFAPAGKFFRRDGWSVKQGRSADEKIDQLHFDVDTEEYLKT